MSQKFSVIQIANLVPEAMPPDTLSWTGFHSDVVTKASSGATSTVADHDASQLQKCWIKAQKRDRPGIAAGAKNLQWKSTLPWLPYRLPELDDKIRRRLSIS